MQISLRLLPRVVVIGLAAAPAFVSAQQPAAQTPIYTTQIEQQGPARAITALFTQNPYTEYSLLEPGSESFRIKYLPETGPGSTTLGNDTRGGSEGGDVEVYDPRTGDPLKFTYGPKPGAPDTHTILATLPMTVPQGGIGRVLIYKTYKDERTYRMVGDDIAWVRGLNGYRLGVVLPKGFAFISSDVAAQLTTTADGRLKLAFANPSGQSNPVTIRAKKTTAVFAPSPFTDMFFDDIKTLYDLGDPATHTMKVEQTYSDYRKGSSASLDSLAYLPLTDMKVIDLDTAKELAPIKKGTATTVALEVPIVNERQSVHLKLTGTVTDATYKDTNGDLVFTRALHGLRNTIVLPAGYDVSAVSQAGTIGINQGRQFVALINMNSENNYSVTIRAHKR